MVSEPHHFARSLRLDLGEDILGARLRGSRFRAKFKRQVPIGRYVVDFCCRAARLIVEIDGVQHAWRSPCGGGRTKTLEGAV
jgi:very-short-patch-repair endonuclease